MHFSEKNVKTKKTVKNEQRWGAAQRIPSIVFSFCLPQPCNKPIFPRVVVLTVPDPVQYHAARFYNVLLVLSVCVCAVLVAPKISAVRFQTFLMTCGIFVSVSSAPQSTVTVPKCVLMPSP